mmetsp:Transcript_32289/g.77405  ORF Transcript_32289/g.77405 Transcript_32289/m.77405 type:complete len:274 (+) Transcript_32289:1370-2191(+)
MTARSNSLTAKSCWSDVRVSCCGKRWKSNERRDKNNLSVTSTNVTGMTLVPMDGGPTGMHGTRIGGKVGVMPGINGKAMRGRSGARREHGRSSPRRPRPRERTGVGSKMNGRIGTGKGTSGMNGTIGTVGRGRSARQDVEVLNAGTSRRSGGTGTPLASGKNGRSRAVGSLSRLRRKRRLTALQRPVHHPRFLLPVGPTTTRIPSQRVRNPVDPKCRGGACLVALWLARSAVRGQQEKRVTGAHRQLLTLSQRASRRRSPQSRRGATRARRRQ